MSAEDFAIVREALEYQERESGIGPLFPEAQDALARIAALLTEVGRERNRAQTDLAACRMGRGEAEACLAEAHAQVGSVDGIAEQRLIRAEAAEARLAEVEKERDDWRIRADERIKVIDEKNIMLEDYRRSTRAAEARLEEVEKERDEFAEAMHQASLAVVRRRAALALLDGLGEA